MKNNNGNRKRSLVILQLCFFLTLQTYSQENIYEIFALEFGHDDSFRPIVSDIAIGSTSNDTLRGNFVFWLLKGNNGRPSYTLLWILLEIHTLRVYKNRNFNPPLCNASPEKKANVFDNLLIRLIFNCG